MPPTIPKEKKKREIIDLDSDSDSEESERQPTPTEILKQKKYKPLLKEKERLEKLSDDGLDREIWKFIKKDVKEQGIYDSKEEAINDRYKSRQALINDILRNKGFEKPLNFATTIKRNRVI